MMVLIMMMIMMMMMMMMLLLLLMMIKMMMSQPRPQALHTEQQASQQTRCVPSKRERLVKRTSTNSVCRRVVSLRAHKNE